VVRFNDVHASGYNSGTPHLVSEINFLVLSVNLVSAPLSLSCLFMLLPHLLTKDTRTNIC